MNKGLSKFQIDKFFKDEKNEEIKKKKKLYGRLFYGFNNKIYKLL